MEKMNEPNEKQNNFSRSKSVDIKKKKIIQKRKSLGNYEKPVTTETSLHSQKKYSNSCSNSSYWKEKSNPKIEKIILAINKTPQTTPTPSALFLPKEKDILPSSSSSSSLDDIDYDSSDSETDTDSETDDINNNKKDNRKHKRKRKSRKIDGNNLNNESEDEEGEDENDEEEEEEEDNENNEDNATNIFSFNPFDKEKSKELSFRQKYLSRPIKYSFSTVLQYGIEVLSSIFNLRVDDPFGMDEIGKEILVEASLKGVADYIKRGKAKNIIVLSGAGISTTAGIPDFRSPKTGLYSNLQKYNLPYPEAIFTLDYFKVNPEPFYQMARQFYPGNYKPTISHYFIKELQNRKLLLRNYTQNIDALERICGISDNKIVEAHGSFNSAYCIGTVDKRGCRKTYDYKWLYKKLFPDNGEFVIPRCEQCNGLVKPAISFFGESIPDMVSEYAKEDFVKCDLLIVMGTSLKVEPLARLVNEVRDDVPRLLINKTMVGRFDKEKSNHYQSNNWDNIDIFNDPDYIDTPINRDVIHLGDSDETCLKLAGYLGFKKKLIKVYEKEMERLDIELDIDIENEGYDLEKTKQLHNNDVLETENSNGNTNPQSEEVNTKSVLESETIAIEKEEIENKINNDTIDEMANDKEESKHLNNTISVSTFSYLKSIDTSIALPPSLSKITTPTSSNTTSNINPLLCLKTTIATPTPTAATTTTTNTTPATAATTNNFSLFASIQAATNKYIFRDTAAVSSPTSTSSISTTDNNNTTNSFNSEELNETSIETTKSNKTLDDKEPQTLLDILEKEQQQQQQQQSEINFEKSIHYNVQNNQSKLSMGLKKTNKNKSNEKEIENKINKGKGKGKLLSNNPEIQIYSTEMIDNTTLESEGNVKIKNKNSNIRLTDSQQDLIDMNSNLSSTSSSDNVLIIKTMSSSSSHSQSPLHKKKSKQNKKGHTSPTQQQQQQPMLLPNKILKKNNSKKNTKRVIELNNKIVSIVPDNDDIDSLNIANENNQKTQIHSLTSSSVSSLSSQQQLQQLQQPTEAGNPNENEGDQLINYEEMELDDPLEGNIANPSENLYCDEVLSRRLQTLF